MMLGPVDEKFTRNDIFYNPAPPSSINTAPVIPTSSQYGLAIVPDGPGAGDVNTPTANNNNMANTPLTEGGDKSDSDREIVHNRYIY
jgi:hypothetical protein